MSNPFVSVIKGIGKGVTASAKFIGNVFSDISKADKLFHEITPEVKTATATFLAAIIKTVSDAQAAAQDKGLDISEDEVIVADIKTIVIAAKNDLPILLNVLKELGVIVKS